MRKVCPRDIATDSAASHWPKGIDRTAPRTSSDTFAITGSDNQMVDLSQPGSGTMVREFSYADEQWVMETAFFHQAPLLAVVGQGDRRNEVGRLKVWNFETGELVADRTPAGHPGWRRIEEESDEGAGLVWRVRRRSRGSPTEEDMPETESQQPRATRRIGPAPARPRRDPTTRRTRR